MRKIFEFIFNEILYNGHLQTIGSLSVVIFSSLLFDIQVTWDLLLILYLNFYIIYLYNRYQEINIDYLTNKERTEHLLKFKKYIPAVIIILLACLIALLIYFADFSFIIFIAAITVFGFLYTVFFKKLTKHIIIFKNIYVAAFFALLVIYPFIYYDLPFKSMLTYIVPLVIFVFLRAVSMQLILDLKDIKSDQGEGLLTLGVLWGRERALKALMTLSFLVAGLGPLIMVVLLDFPASAIAMTLLLLFDFYIIDLIKKESPLAYILESGEFIIWPVLILLGDKII